MKKNKGITLIALVITIVIMLILAGVTLNAALGENGLFKRAKQAVETYQKASQKEYLEQSMLAMQMDSLSGSSPEEESSKKIGVKLYKRSLKHTTDWHIIEADHQRYDDDKGDWYFVKKGDDLEGYGKADHSMLVNYDTGEIKELEEGEYIDLSAGDMVYVKDNMIINIDSSIIDEGVSNDEASLKDYFGEDVTLHNFNYTEDSGASHNGFVFDGIDDYMTVEYQDETKVDSMLQNGFTFEFYGTSKPGTRYDYADDRWSIYTLGGDFFGGFAWGDGEATHASRLHFMFDVNPPRVIMTWANNPTLTYPAIQSNGDEENYLRLGSGAELPNGWNTYGACKSDNENGLGYFSITINPKTIVEKNGHAAISQKLYSNGSEVCAGWYYLDQWNNLTKNKDQLKIFTIGGTTMNAPGNWIIGKMNIKSLRLYSRALTGDEIR